MALREFAKRVPLPLRRIAYRLGVPKSDRLLLCTEERTRFHRLMGVGLWNIDSVQFASDNVTISGWALPRDVPASRLDLAINGDVTGDARFGLRRDDLGTLYPYVPHAPASGFSITIPIASLEADEVRLELYRHGNRFEGFPPSFVRLSEDRVPVPDAARMRRVHGDTNPNAFKLTGYDRFRKLEEALKCATGSGFARKLDVLDWGCGSGRIARQFALRTNATLTGVDVDVDNVSWCASNLPFATFEAIPLHPPTQFSDSSFDVVLGLSVFTHLSEPVQFEWLRELERVLRPDGCALVTVHGFAAVAQQAGWPVSLLNAWEHRGFIDGTSHDLDGYIPERGYYRTALHHPDYIQREWTRVFPVVDLVDPYVGNQALCVLRKTAPPTDDAFQARNNLREALLG